MNPWSRLAGTALLLGALASPAFAQTGLPQLPNPADYGAKGYPVPANAGEVPVPAPQRGVNLPDVPQLPTGAPAGLDMQRVLDSLGKNYPEIFGDFRNGTNGQTATNVFEKVLERVRTANPDSGLDQTPLGKISPQTAEQAMEILTALGTAAQDGNLQRGQVPEAMGGLLPPGLGNVMSELALEPQQIQQFQAILFDVVPAMIGGKPEELKAMEGPLRERLEGVFTKKQRDTLRRAEEQLRTK